MFAGNLLTLPYMAQYLRIKRNIHKYIYIYIYKYKGSLEGMELVEVKMLYLWFVKYILKIDDNNITCNRILLYDFTNFLSRFTFRYNLRCNLRAGDTSAFYSRVKFTEKRVCL